MSAVLTSVSREKGKGKTVSYIKYPSAWAPVISVDVHQRQSPDAASAQRPHSASGSPEKPKPAVRGGGLSDGQRARPTSALPGGRKLVVDLPSPERHSFQVMSISHASYVSGVSGERRVLLVGQLAGQSASILDMEVNQRYL